MDIINNCGDNRAFGIKAKAMMDYRKKEIGQTEWINLGRKQNKLTINKDMELKKNTFYQYKDADTYERVDDIHTNKYVVTIFSKNFVEIGKILWDIEDLDGWEEVPKTLQTLCVGDIVVNNECEYKKVLGVVNQKCYIMSDWRSAILKDNEDKCVTSYSVKELEDFGYEPYIEDIEDTEVEEVTIEKDNWRKEIVKIFKEHGDEIIMRDWIHGVSVDTRPMTINGEDIIINNK